MVAATSEVSSTVVSHQAATMVPRPVSERAIHHTQQEHPRTGIAVHQPRHAEVASSSTHPASHSILVTHTSVSVGAADIPYTLHRTHATNFTHTSHMPLPPHGVPQYPGHGSHAQHSVHFSDTTQQAHDRAPAPHISPSSASSQVFHPRSGSTILQSHTPQPPPTPASSTYHHTTQQPQPICSTLSSQSKQHAAIYHGQTAYPSHQVMEASSHHAKTQHSTYSVYTPHTKDLGYTKHIPYTAYYTHETSHSHSGYPPDPTAKTSHIGYHSQTTVASSKPTVHSSQTVSSAHDAYHSSQGPSVTPLSHKVSPQSSHTTTTLPPTKPARSTHPSSQPTVWRHSWTEGEAKEQRVWGARQEVAGVVETPSAYFYDQGKSKQGRESQHDNRSGENTTTGELTSLLRRFDRRTPSEQSLLMTERDEDTLI